MVMTSEQRESRLARRASLWILLVLLGCAGVANGVAMASSAIRDGPIAGYFFFAQDQILLPLYLFFVLVARASWTVSNGGEARSGAPLKPYAMMFAVIGLILFCRAGHHLVLADYDLSRDEQMANFDAAIFSSGRLFWPLDPALRPFADALNQTFIQPIGDHEAWVSAYLPVNAAFRAIVGTLFGAAWTSPLFVGLGAVCLWLIAKQLWPASGNARAAALLFYVGSSQIVLTGMTAYAMSAHLGLNLLWLLLFLRDRPRCDGAALLVGFLATGLHQPLFHPMFVAPFLCLLVQRREWRRLGLYVAIYALIGIFWLAWPVWISSFGSAAIPANGAPGGVGYLSRLQASFKIFDMSALCLTAMNLVRLATWQHLLLLPLAALGIATGWKRTPLVRALAASLLLPVLLLALLLPYQGHGWGYRYVHGALGSACLLGGFGIAALEARGIALRTPMRWATGLSLLLLLPLHLWMAHRMILPFEALDRRIARSLADIVVVDDAGVPLGQDVVRNRPDLRNRPVRLKGSRLDGAQIAALCSGRSVAFLDAPAMRGIADMLHFVPPSVATPGQLRLQQAARRAGCRVQPL